jgi:pimeloyl-ACP methyl ester carboxylesterase
MGETLQAAVITETMVPTDAGTFNALAAGPEDGIPVLLLHGFPQFAIQWQHQLAALGANGFRAVAPDQRCYSPGVRPADVAGYAVDHLVDDVLRIAGALAWDTFHLAGHDWGAAVRWARGVRAGPMMASGTPCKSAGDAGAWSSREWTSAVRVARV